jgi:hypothetical protein
MAVFSSIKAATVFLQLANALVKYAEKSRNIDYGELKTMQVQSQITLRNVERAREAVIRMRDSAEHKRVRDYRGSRDE